MQASRLTPRALQLAALTSALLTPGLAAADQITLQGAGGSLDGKLVQTTGTEGVIESNGWRVRVPLRDVLAVRRGEAWSVPRVDLAEDAGLLHESRAEYFKAFIAYERALKALLGSEARGAIPTGEAAAVAEVFLRRLHVFALRASISKQAAAVFHKVAEGDLLTPLARSTARTYLVRHMRRLGYAGTAAAAERTLGTVTSFFVIGSFDNERGIGFDQAHGPETEPFDPGKTYKGKSFPVSWRALPFKGLPRGEVDLDALMEPNDQALGYAITYVHAQRPTRVALRLGSDEAVKVWVNRTAVHSNKLRRSYHFDQDHIGVVLKAGWNEVLLKVCDQTGDWRFRLRITTPSGAAVSGVRVGSPAEIAGKPAFEQGAETFTLPQGGRTPLLAMARRAGATWRDWFRLGYLHYGLQAHDETQHPDREAFAQAIKLSEKQAHLHVFLSYTLGGAGQHAINQENNARRQSLERALALDPKHWEARWMLASYYADELNNADRARKILAPAVKGAKHALPVQLLQMQLDREADLGPLVDARLRKLLEQAEGRIQRDEAQAIPSALLSEALSAARGRGDVKRQLQLYEQLLEHDKSDASVLLGLAQLYRGAHRLGLADMFLRQAIKAAPFATPLRAQLARQLASRDKLLPAQKQLEAALTISPDEAGLVVQLGHLLERRGKTKQASAQFQRALALNPKLVDLKKYLKFRARRETREKPFEDAWSVDPKALIKKAQSIAVDPRQTHRYLLRQEVAKVNQDGTKSEYTQEVYRIENREGAKQLTSFAAYYQSDQRIELQRARVYRKAGGVEDAPVGSSRGGGGEFTSGRRYFVRFPPLEVGDVIEVRYRVDDLQQSFFGDYYGKVAFFQGEERIDWMRYVLLAPTSRQFYFHTPGLKIEPAKVADTAKKQVSYVWERKGIAALESEPNMPWAKETLPQVQVSTFKDWNTFAKWYWGLVASQHEADAPLKAKVKELCEGAKTPAEKIRRIYNYVVTDIRYNASWEFGIHGFKPYNATKIFARKFGDCKDKSTLINTMLREVGIKSYPVLIFGEDGRGREDLTLPLMRHFNHCISWVDHGEGVFVDGTAEHHPYPSLPTMDYGAKVVVVTPEGGQVKTIDFRDPSWNAVREKHTVKLERSGDAKVTMQIQATGTFEVVLRSWLDNKGRRKELLEPRIGRVHTGARVKSVTATDMKNLDQKVKVTIEAELPKLLRKMASGDLELTVIRSWMFDLLYLRGEKISGLAADTKRKHDLVLPVPSGVEEEVMYQLPKGLRIRSLPRGTKLETPFGTYELTYTREKGNRLKAKRVLKLKTNRIPKAQYEAFRKFVEQIDQAESEKPVLGKGGETQ